MFEGRKVVKEFQTLNTTGQRFLETQTADYPLSLRHILEESNP